MHPLPLILSLLATVRLHIRYQRTINLNYLFLNPVSCNWAFQPFFQYFVQCCVNYVDRSYTKKKKLPGPTANVAILRGAELQYYQGDKSSPNYMKTYSSREGDSDKFLTSVLDSGEWLDLRW